MSHAVFRTHAEKSLVSVTHKLSWMSSAVSANPSMLTLFDTPVEEGELGLAELRGLGSDAHLRNMDHSA